MERMRSDTEFYREYLRDHPEREHSPFTVGLTALTGLASLYVAYRKGLLRSFAEQAIRVLGSYQSGTFHAISRGIRNWTLREFKDKPPLRYQLALLKSDIRHSLAEHREERLRQLSKPFLTDKPGEILRLLGQRNDIVHQLNDVWMRMTKDEQEEVLKRYQSVSNWKKAVARKINDIIDKKNNITEREQQELIRRTGYRYATVADVLPYLSDFDRDVIELAQMDFGKKFLNKIYDHYLLVHAETGEFADLREFRERFGGVLDSLADDFTIPFVKINPIRLLYLRQFSAAHKPPMFYLLHRETIQPAITKNTQALGRDLLFLDGQVVDIVDLDRVVTKNVRLVEGQKGPIARYYRNLVGLSTSKYTAPKSGPRRFLYEVAQLFDVGFQDEPIGRDLGYHFRVGKQSVELPQLTDPTTWPSWVAQKLHNLFRPYEEAQRIRLEHAFGVHAEYIVFNNYRTYEEVGNFKDWIKQFYAGRKDLEHVTTATLFPYGFFERLNATLNQVGLGLSNEKLGSAFDVFWNLVLYRILPVYAIVEAWDYLNYLSDTFLGFQFEDAFAKFYAGASVDIAELRDALGITDWAKHYAHLFPGGDQIAELPLIGRFFQLNMSAEETREYWESGEDPVRKGRYWEFGNTPFTGGKIEYFQPNWVRRVLSDYKFSDSLYGSREEYFANAPYPTPTHPLAPLRHFILDPYHWEEKHYYDRPYLLTGGFPEFEEFPLIGPLLNTTIGELLKPPVRMHLEYWSAPKDGEVYAALEGGQFVLPDEAGAAVPPLDPIGLAVAETVELGLEESSENESEMAPAPLALIPSREEVEAEPETRLMAYITASGQIQVAKVPVSAISKLNEKIKEKSLLSVPGTEMLLESDSPTVELPAQPLMLPGSAPATIGNFYYNLTEMGGIYGFGLMTMTGELFREPTIATSTDMTSFRRAFWDLNIGNLGSDANEIFRRFLPKDRKLQEYNPVPNRMPDWLPGEDYFINFQVGDPYTKIPKGEMRLPGEGYERLYNVQVDMDLSLGASYIGYDVPTIINHLLHRDEIKDDEEAYRLKTGEKWHAKFEQEMMQKDIAVDFEQYVSDASLNIGGFYDMKVDNLKWLHFVAENASVLKYYPSASAKGALGLEGYEGFFAEPLDYRALPDDAARASMLEDLMSGVGQAIIEIKTMGPERFNQDRMFFEHAQQMNFYLYATGIPRGYLVYINREDIEQGQESELKVYAIDFNPDLLHYSLQKVEAAREYIRQGLETGEITRGDFYSMLDRYRILADVAPYSEEFRQMRRQIRNWQGLDEEALEEVREIEKQVSAKKKSLRLYEYRFKTANIEKHLVTVKEVINNNMFLVEEFDHPIRFAGIYVPSGKDDPKAKQARRLINLKPGDKIVIGIDADELRQVRDDTYRTIAAVVYNKGINVNRALLEAGLAKEKENDFSPAAVHARFSSNEILLGKIWETFAHMDTPYHTKFLQVRSALESYERREVYNKDWQEWSEPFEDYFIPWYQNIIRKEPLLALVTGTMLGSLFGNTRYGKIMGALTGFVLTSLGVAYVSTYEELTGRNWVPERRLREWELFEYLDMIKYVKYRRLYEWAADKALEEEGVDVRKLLAEQKAKGELREAEREYLEDLKRRLVVGDEDERLAAQEEAWDLGFEGENLIKAINRRIKELANSREAMPIGPWTARALMYYQMSERTMYGYDPGEPLANFLAALPKKDREYLVPFIQAPEEERDRILEVTPPYIRRVLQAAWGLPVEPKPDLVTYFTQHGLPEPDWIGWDPRASLKDLTVKMVKREKLDPSEFDIWPSDEQQAAYVKMEPPSLHARLSPVEVKRRLEDVLRGLGLEEVYVEVAKKEAADGLDSVDALILKNRQVDIVRKMNEEAANLL